MKIFCGDDLQLAKLALAEPADPNTETSVNVHATRPTHLKKSSRVSSEWSSSPNGAGCSGIYTSFGLIPSFWASYDQFTPHARHRSSRSQHSQHALLWGREGRVWLSQHFRSTETRSQMTKNKQTNKQTNKKGHCECSVQPIKTDGILCR